MKILVAYDGSEHANAAIDDLCLAGLPAQATALVLSVVDAWLPEEGDADETLPGLKDIRSAAEQQVAAQLRVAHQGADRLRAAFPGWNVAAHACADSPAVAIIRRAEGESGGVDGSGQPADLTVVGSRGLGAIKRIFLGSVARAVMHGLRGSLRIARDRVAPEQDNAADDSRSHGSERVTNPPRIVVGVDGSADSNAAVRTVASRPWPIGTHVLLACYAQGIRGLEHSLALAEFASGVWSGDAASARGPIDSWATRTVADAARTVRNRCPGAIVSTVVRLGDPKYALMSEASNWEPGGGGTASSEKRSGSTGADCIFVGVRGVRGMERLLLGSVSAGVGMNAPCSVEIVHR